MGGFFWSEIVDCQDFDRVQFDELICVQFEIDHGYGGRLISASFRNGGR